MKDYLPLLIGAIWIAFSLYNKGKKKTLRSANNDSLAKQGQRTPSLIEQLLSGNFMEAEKIYTTDNYESPAISNANDYDFEDIVEEKKVTKPFLNEELSQFSFEGEEVGFDSIKSQDNYWTQDIEEISGNDFDLKKAVVYSAILNPPYIDS